MGGAPRRWLSPPRSSNRCARYWRGGVVDTVLTAFANFVLTIPAFPLLIVLAALIQLSNFIVLAALIAALAWPVLMRAVSRCRS